MGAAGEPGGGDLDAASAPGLAHVGPPAGVAHVHIRFRPLPPRPTALPRLRHAGRRVRRPVAAGPYDRGRDHGNSLRPWKCSAARTANPSRISKINVESARSMAVIVGTGC